MRETDIEFIKYIDRGLTGVEPLLLGDKVTTEKVLDLGGQKMVSNIYVTDLMVAVAKRKDVLTVELVDESDDTCYLSDGYWYPYELLTKINK